MAGSIIAFFSLMLGADAGAWLILLLGAAVVVLAAVSIEDLRRAFVERLSADSRPLAVRTDGRPSLAILPACFFGWSQITCALNGARMGLRGLARSGSSPPVLSV